MFVKSHREGHFFGLLLMLLSISLLLALIVEIPTSRAANAPMGDPSPQCMGDYCTFKPFKGSPYLTGSCAEPKQGEKPTKDGLIGKPCQVTKNVTTCTGKCLGEQPLCGNATSCNGEKTKDAKETEKKAIEDYEDNQQKASEKPKQAPESPNDSGGDAPKEDSQQPGNKGPQTGMEPDFSKYGEWSQPPQQSPPSNSPPSSSPDFKFSDFGERGSIQPSQTDERFSDFGEGGNPPQSGKTGPQPSTFGNPPPQGSGGDDSQGDGIGDKLGEIASKAKDALKDSATDFGELLDDLKKWLEDLREQLKGEVEKPSPTPSIGDEIAKGETKPELDPSGAKRERLDKGTINSGKGANVCALGVCGKQFTRDQLNNLKGKIIPGVRTSKFNEVEGTAYGGKNNPNAFTTASKEFPAGARILEYNLKTGDTVAVSVNDTGPFVAGRYLDTTPAGLNAAKLGDLSNPDVAYMGQTGPTGYMGKYSSFDDAIAAYEARQGVGSGPYSSPVASTLPPFSPPPVNYPGPSFTNETAPDSWYDNSGWDYSGFENVTDWNDLSSTYVQEEGLYSGQQGGQELGSDPDPGFENETGGNDPDPGFENEVDGNDPDPGFENDLPPTVPGARQLGDELPVEGFRPDPGFENYLGNDPDPGFENEQVGNDPDPGFENEIDGNDPDPGFENDADFDSEQERLSELERAGKELQRQEDETFASTMARNLQDWTEQAFASDMARNIQEWTETRLAEIQQAAIDRLSGDTWEKYLDWDYGEPTPEGDDVAEQPGDQFKQKDTFDPEEERLAEQKSLGDELQRQAEEKAAEKEKRAEEIAKNLDNEDVERGKEMSQPEDEVAKQARQEQQKKEEEEKRAAKQKEVDEAMKKSAEADKVKEEAQKRAEAADKRIEERSKALSDATEKKKKAEEAAKKSGGALKQAKDNLNENVNGIKNLKGAAERGLRTAEEVGKQTGDEDQVRSKARAAIGRIDTDPLRDAAESPLLSQKQKDSLIGTANRVDRNSERIETLGTNGGSVAEMRSLASRSIDDLGGALSTAQAGLKNENTTLTVQAASDARALSVATAEFNNAGKSLWSSAISADRAWSSYYEADEASLNAYIESWKVSGEGWDLGDIQTYTPGLPGSGDIVPGFVAPPTDQGDLLSMDSSAWNYDAEGWVKTDWDSESVLKVTEDKVFESILGEDTRAWQQVEQMLADEQEQAIQRFLKRWENEPENWETAVDPWRPLSAAAQEKADELQKKIAAEHEKIRAAKARLEAGYGTDFEKIPTRKLFGESEANKWRDDLWTAQKDLAQYEADLAKVKRDDIDAGYIDTAGEMNKADLAARDALSGQLREHEEKLESVIAAERQERNNVVQQYIDDKRMTRDMLEAVTKESRGITEGALGKDWEKGKFFGFARDLQYLQLAREDALIRSDGCGENCAIKLYPEGSQPPTQWDRAVAAVKACFGFCGDATPTQIPTEVPTTDWSAYKDSDVLSYRPESPLDHDIPGDDVAEQPGRIFDDGQLDQPHDYDGDEEYAKLNNEQKENAIRALQDQYKEAYAEFKNADRNDTQKLFSALRAQNDRNEFFARLQEDQSYQEYMKNRPITVSDLPDGDDLEDNEIFGVSYNKESAKLMEELETWIKDDWDKHYKDVPPEPPTRSVAPSATKVEPPDPFPADATDVPENVKRPPKDEPDFPADATDVPESVKRPPKAETPPPAAAKTPPTPGPTASGPGPGPSGGNADASGSGSGSGGGLGGIFEKLMNALKDFFKPKEQKQNQQQQQAQQGQQTPPAIASIFARPPTVKKGEKTRLIWGSVNTTSCIVFDELSNEVARGTSDGAATTTALFATTKFKVTCQGKNGSQASASTQVTVTAATPTLNKTKTNTTTTKTNTNTQTKTQTNTNTNTETQTNTGAKNSTDEICHPSLPYDEFVACVLR
ncbi:hypothetical protein HY969_00145 [Candidatus Kaiserbacteria bacterium]|nr:hypothetical protein [Candidatus Kaiserbacteria bacterium]